MQNFNKNGTQQKIYVIAVLSLSQKFVSMNKCSDRPKVKCFKVRNYAYFNRYQLLGA